MLARVGALVEGPAFHPYLSGRDNLARLEAADRTTDPRTARARIDAALDRVGLLAAATKRYRAYSLGMRQRLAIASALLRPRDLLVLDEPTNGLDPQGTREVRTLVGSLADEGATVLVSSHLLSEVEQMCTHLGVMHVGTARRPGHQRRGAGRDRDPGSARDRPARRRPARIMRELGLTEVRTSHVSATGNARRDLTGEDRRRLRPPGCARPRLPGRRPVARGRVRLADRGGLRCQWLRQVGAASITRPLSTRFLRSELRLIFRRRRNLAGLLVLASVPGPHRRRGQGLLARTRDGDGPDFFSSITENGLFVALASLTLELGLFLPLAVAAISGDSVAGEANIGTLRYLLAVPVQRARLLAVKYLAIVIFSLVATLTVTVTGIVMGLALFGGGDMTLLSGTQIGFAEGLLRVMAASLYLAVCFASLGAVGLFVSTLTEQPIGAMIAVVIFSTASFIARQHPSDQLAAPVPDHPPLARVRGPPPVPDRLGRRPARSVRRAGLRGRVLAGGMGALRRQGRHQLSPAAGCCGVRGRHAEVAVAGTRAA